MQFRKNAKYFKNAEEMAQAFLSEYFGEERIEYPINPFQMLKDEGVLFSFMKFKKLEGVYIPAENTSDFPIVGINIERPITRQRFTAAHELCHHFRDADIQVSCPIGANNQIERFANAFAAALLMPIDELSNQVEKKRNKQGNVEFDDVLEIADFFGVSFEACLFRIAYQLQAISGDTDHSELKNRIKKYRPDIVRKNKHMTYVTLYESLIDSYQEQLIFQPNEHARYVYQNEYIYNDSRIEGLDVTIEQASEIVTDLRMNTQNSKYCNEENEAFLSIAGHYEMYKEIFSEPVKNDISVYEMLSLNKKLFSHYPYPEFGGNIRQNNTLVLCSKFETVDCHDIYSELAKLDYVVKEYFDKKEMIPMSEFVEHVARTHHKITVIHPFSDGNGRTARAFMNMQFVRAGMVPVFIKIEDRDRYIKALERADNEDDYDELYEMIFQLIIRNSADLSRFPY